MSVEPITTNLILYCRKYDNSVRFYRDRLHLPITFSTDWFTEFRLNEMSRLSVADENRVTIKSGGGNGITLSWKVDALQAIWNDFEKNGLTPTAIKEHPWNASVFFLFDPEGNRIEFWESV